MIRRNVLLPDGSAGWSLISQVEHARISAELALHSTAGEWPADVVPEVIEGIRRHDDGWAEWERAPRVDAATGRPVSFMELEPGESAAIWSRSIESARECGPLAGWMVSGHFLRLAGQSETMSGDAELAAWMEAMEAERGGWLAAWQQRSPEHTADVAGRALEWLWAFDEASLWLCCRCPAVGEESDEPVADSVGVGTQVEMELRWQGGSEGRAAGAPWRFDSERIRLEVEGKVTKARRFAESEAVLAACRPVRLGWVVEEGSRQ